ncbi:DUF1835 domain-containing protein [Aureibacter tunicatorum]|uniref:DUF1835 domain-containing protein n=1 Tax=Aureibacter tunicatorum TaxID=866807 RepID=A0AAE3XJ57_9BACT|nr:DUF1835 domain-containing protein [Aureibacter tunicatorum]MDR6237827.1 hypothetical protein [Aureibacter tunicatorum]BDD02863.1 hypothetical protein AUTU_03460 [Aureibacter tunicatorum]
MIDQIHILNGDCFKVQFPKTLKGELIVLRECLVEGDVKASSIKELYELRSRFISESYGGGRQEYFDKVVSELDKIERIKAGAEINLWFEDDLFCQVNFWFAINLLMQKGRNNKLFLVRPDQHTQYGFGGLNNDELISIFNNRSIIEEPEKIADLWKYYQVDDNIQLLGSAKKLDEVYPFIFKAVEAHVERVSADGDLGRPEKTIKKIIEELGTKDFGLVFQEFNKRENIYGFGDLQVKRIFDKVLDHLKV